MSDVNNTRNEFEPNVIRRDETLDLTAVLGNIRKENNLPETLESESVESDTIDEYADEYADSEIDDEEENTGATINRAPIPGIIEEDNLSPVERALIDQEKKGKNLGLVVKDEDIKEEGHKKLIQYNDDRMDAIEAEANNYDAELEKRKKVILIRKPLNQLDYIQLMDEISAVKTLPDGTTIIDLSNDEGEEASEPKFIRVRKDDEPMFDYSILSEFEKEHIIASNKDAKEEIKKITVVKDDGTTEEVEDKADEISPEKKKIVKILIDKTNLGTDFMFTPEEKEKIEESDVIQVNEVKLIDINAIRAKKVNKSFQDVIKSYDYNGQRTTICFPASGFKAQMKGLSYGEFADISLTPDTVTFDRYHKRLSIIYNKMVNISTGPFKDFEDFLKNFASIDIALALYGMYIATEQENQSIPLRCGNKSCGKGFNWNFSTRSVLRLERCSDRFLNNMKKIATADPSDYDEIKKDSAVMNSKVLELPDSGIVCEIGIVSAYEFLYNFIPTLDEAKFNEAFGSDENDIYGTNRFLLSYVRSMYIPDGNGGYIECLGYKDILDAIYNLSPREIQIFIAYVTKLQSEWDITFSLGDITCPHCRAVTKDMDLSIDELVFQTYSRLMNTTVDVENIQEF